MLTFRIFLEDTEEDNNILSTLKKLPPSHAKLAKGYRFVLKGDNTLPGDNEHIGSVSEKDKEICVAAPWFYSREFVMLHELAHRLFSKLNPKLKRRWQEIVNDTKNKNDQGAEEDFAMAYAAANCKHPPKTHCVPERIAFIKEML